jgi:hypothetical protein
VKTEYLSSAQMERLDHSRLAVVLPSDHQATIRFMRDGKLTFARVSVEDVQAALFHRRSVEVKP